MQKLNCEEDFSAKKCLIYMKCNNMHQSIYYGHINCLKKYLILKPNLNEEKTEEECGFDKYTLPIAFLGIARPLTLSFINNNFEITKILLENGADPNYIVSHSTNNTLLHKACFCLRTKFVKILLMHGANIYSINIDNKTSLDIANDVKNELMEDAINQQTFLDSVEDLTNVTNIIEILEKYMSEEEIKEPSED